MLSRVSFSFIRFMKRTKVRNYSNPVNHGQKHISTYDYKRIEFHMSDMMYTAAYDMTAATKIAQQNILTQVSIQQANTIASELLITNKDGFRDLSQKTVQAQMVKTTPHAPWESLMPCGGAVPAFRGVTTNGNYGFPDYTFVNGIPAAIFNTRSGNKILVPASIVSYVHKTDQQGNQETKLSIANRHDMMGFVFGSNISTSLNAGHVIDERYTATHLRYQNDRYIYLLAIREGYSVGHAIYTGSGYIRNKAEGEKGKKGVSCQEDACEVGAGVYLGNHQVLGVRKVSASGQLSPFQMNPDANHEMFAETLKYVDTHIYLEANTIEEIRYLEALMLTDPEKVEFYTKRINGYHRLDEELHRQIQLEAMNRDNPGANVSALLQEQCATNVISEGQRYHFFLFSQSVKYKQSVNDGKLLDAKQKAFHDKKAPTEEELKKRAANAEKQKSQQPAVDTTPVFRTNM